jgi:hypothetical protein
MVAPRTGQQQVTVGNADPFKAILLEHSLRGDIFEQRASLHAVKPCFAEREIKQFGNRCGGEPAPLAGLGNPVTDGGALERPPDRVQSETMPQIAWRSRIANRQPPSVADLQSHSRCPSGVKNDSERSGINGAKNERFAV